MFCTNCGKQIPGDSAFCEFCGTKIDTGEAAGEPVKMQPHQEKKAESGPENNKSNKVLTILASVLLIAVSCVLVLAFVGRKGKDEPQEAERETEDVQVQVSETVQNESEADNSIEDFLKKGIEADNSQSDIQDSEEAIAEPEENALELNGTADFSDFKWVDANLPEGTTKFEDIEKASGKWKCLLNAFSSADVNGRIMFSEADIQHHGDKVTIYLDVKSRYEYPADNPTEYELVAENESWVMELRGEWDASFGSIEAKSEQSELRIDINQFSEGDNVQYAMGDVYNGDQNIGFIFLVRP